MQKYHPDNERIKKRYFDFEKEARQQSESTIDSIAKSLSRFEEYTKWKDFRVFHIEQAIAFKRELASQKNKRTGKPLAKSTMMTTVGHLRQFFRWLSQQAGYKSRLSYTDAEYFNLSEKDTRIASARQPKKVPTIEQIRHVVEHMPGKTDIERRDRAIIAFTMLTAARVDAVASFKLKHVDLANRCVYQDARDVKTKFSKTFMTCFFPVDEPFEQVVVEWVGFLRQELQWGNDDPLFPSTRVDLGEGCEFQVVGLAREHWRSTGPIRSIFRQAFEAAGVPYFNPHSFRDTVTQLGERICKTPEEFKAWSQSLGHEDVMTTLMSYGKVSEHRQKEIFSGLASGEMDDRSLRLELRKLLDGRE